MTITRSTAAVPTRRFSRRPDAPPENAVIVAVPLCPPEMNLTRTCPLLVRASLGSMRPSVVVKDTSVPFWTGVPAPVVVVGVVVPGGVVPVPSVGGGVAGGGVVVVPCSMTVATISTSLFKATVELTGNNVITVPLGASRGTLSHAEAKAMKPRAQTAERPAARRPRPNVLESIRDDKDNTLMGLQGQASGRSERGYAMAALLVSIAVMAVMMSVAMPAYRHLARREKETELVFRGEQYARAVALYRAKNGNAFPASIDILVQGKYLRKKYKDPMSKDGEFRIVPVGNPQGGQQGPGQSPGPGRGNQPAGRGNQPAARAAQPPSGGQTGSFVSGGIMGVASKSTETSIRTYKGQTRYDLWPFTFNMVNRPGGQGPAAGQPGGRGEPQPGISGPGRGRGPGGRNPGRGTGPGRGGRGPGGVAILPGGRRGGGL